MFTIIDNRSTAYFKMPPIYFNNSLCAKPFEYVNGTYFH